MGNKLLNEISETISSFISDASKAVEGNKAAGARSRKTSLELEKLLKQWRKESVKK